MCGRYALALRPSQVRQMLQDDNMLVWEAPEDDADRDGGPRQTYNFAPGYHGIVYRADVPDWGAGPRRETKVKLKAKVQGGKMGDSAAGHNVAAAAADDVPAVTSPPKGQDRGKEVHYKLQSMKWGLIPFWTKRNPDYASVMKTINCRDDSLSQGGGMWSSMKARKRCIVIAQGFYEWLRSGRDKVPHFVKRKDGHLMCFAGLWDMVQYEDDEQKHYTYTIITTDSNKQLKFLHDRMPVILDPASPEMKIWLDPSKYEWTKELQSILKPFDGELEVYPVSKEVGKVGNDSPSFVIPIASKENKSNIANFFANAKAKQHDKTGSISAAAKPEKPKFEAKKEVCSSPAGETTAVDDFDRPAGDEGANSMAGIKREGDRGIEKEEPPKKKGAASFPVLAKSSSPGKSKKSKISPTSNDNKSPSKGKQNGTQKITKFFSNSG